MTPTLLKILDWFKPLYLWQGIDFTQLRVIVGVKLEMDNRRTSVFRNQHVQDASATFAWMFAVYGILGGLLSLALAFMPSILFAYTIYHAYLMLMVTMTLISDFSAVLLDTSDNTIVLPRPITAKTFYAARTTHILLYIGQISLALALVPMGVTFYLYGPVVGLATILTTILTVVFSVAITNGLYLLLMRFTSEERLKNVINYFQIGMAIFMTAGYQLLPRMFNEELMEAMDLPIPWWSVFIPPMWMASPLEWLNDFHFSWLHLINTGLAVLAPVVLLKGINKYLSPYFTNKLTDLGTSSSVQQPASQRQQKEKPVSSVVHWLTKAGLERATFNLVTYALARDRKLKLRIYPALGYFTVFTFMFLFNAKGKKNISWMDYLQRMSETEAHLMAIYMCIFLIIIVAFEIHYSDEYKAAWIFQSAPIQKPGEILLGTIKAILLRFFIPLYSLSFLLVISIWGVPALVDLVFGFLACLLLILIMSSIGDKFLPLSMPNTGRAQGAGVARTFISLFIIGALAGGHYLLTKYDMALWLASILLFGIAWYLHRQIEKITWDKIGF